MSSLPGLGREEHGDSGAQAHDQHAPLGHLALLAQQVEAGQRGDHQRNGCAHLCLVAPVETVSTWVVAMEGLFPAK
jgi:hypothetical protein